jgi:hypothetical protein
MYDERTMVVGAQGRIISVLQHLEQCQGAPDEIVTKVEAEDQALSVETVRGAIWTLLNMGEIEATWDGKLRLAKSCK